MQINLLIILGIFLSAAILGWVIEVFFRRFFSAKRWINPGFLTGPWLPIYGFGAVAMYLTITLYAKVEASFTSHELYSFCVIITIGVLMTLIEYLGGLIFIKGMHIRLWDYSNSFLNIQGLICPFFSLIWTLAGAIFYFLLYQPLGEFSTFLTTNSYYIFLLGIGYGIMSLDFAISIHFAERIRKFAKNNQTIIHLELLKIDIQNYLASQKEKASFILPIAKFNEVKDKITEQIKTRFNSKNKK